MPVGGVDDATILVRDLQNVSIALPAIVPPLQLSLFFAHYVSVDGTSVPDALMPWDGSPRSLAADHREARLKGRMSDQSEHAVFAADLVARLAPSLIAVLRAASWRG
jgi:hypothetical protein